MDTLNPEVGAIAPVLFPTLFIISDKDVRSVQACPLIHNIWKKVLDGPYRLGPILQMRRLIQVCPDESRDLTRVIGFEMNDLVCARKEY